MRIGVGEDCRRYEGQSHAILVVNLRCGRYGGSWGADLAGASQALERRVSDASHSPLPCPVQGRPDCRGRRAGPGPEGLSCSPPLPLRGVVRAWTLRQDQGVLPTSVVSAHRARAVRGGNTDGRPAGRLPDGECVAQDVNRSDVAEAQPLGGVYTLGSSSTASLRRS